jgi:hypothetical protein
MHVTIRHYGGLALPTDQVRRAGRQLGASLGGAPGFVSYVLVETDGGAVTAISIFETAADSQARDGALARWEAEHLTGPAPGPVETTTGRILVQCGL